MADFEDRKTIVKLSAPEWAQTPASKDEAAPAIQQPEQKSESTGVENVTAVSQGTQRPQNWQEAVDRHFTPQPKPGQASSKSDSSRVGNMQDVIDFLEERKAAIHLPSKDELEKERRRKKTEGIISAMADGASAISNLIFTTQYAPNMYDSKASMVGKWKERYDKLKKDRDADADRYLNYALTIGKLKDAQEAKEYQHGRDALQDLLRQSQETRAQLKADRDAAMADLKMELMAGKITQQQAATRAKEIEAQYADQYWSARVEEVNSRTNKNTRWQPSTGRGGRAGEYPWYDSYGNKHYAHSYEAMRQNAIDSGTWNENTQESSSERTTTDRLGNTKGTTSSKTTKPAKGYSSAPQGKKSNPMGSGNSGGEGKQKKKNPMS